MARALSRAERAQEPFHETTRVHRVLAVWKSDRVVFLGLRSDVSDLLAASDLYVSASHSEGTSLALLEAMARGLPCVVANSPGLADLVTDGANGRLFAVKNGADCARVVTEALADPGASRSQATRAQETVRREFSINALAAEHGSLYGRLLEGA